MTPFVQRAPLWMYHPSCYTISGFLHFNSLFRSHLECSKEVEGCLIFPKLTIHFGRLHFLFFFPELQAWNWLFSSWCRLDWNTLFTILFFNLIVFGQGLIFNRKNDSVWYLAMASLRRWLFWWFSHTKFALQVSLGFSLPRLKLENASFSLWTRLDSTILFAIIFSGLVVFDWNSVSSMRNHGHTNQFVCQCPSHYWNAICWILLIWIPGTRSEAFPILGLLDFSLSVLYTK